MFLTQAKIESYDATTHLYGISISMLMDQRSSLSEVTVLASASETAGILTDYKRGDYVFVAFSDNSLNKPVILGKIRHKNSKYNSGESTTLYDDQADSIYCENLYCKNINYYTGTKQTPENNDLRNNNKNVKGKLEELESRVAALEGRLDGLDRLLNS